MFLIAYPAIGFRRNGISRGVGVEDSDFIGLLKIAIFFYGIAPCAKRIAVSAA
jgi:hypothetical protein